MSHGMERVREIERANVAKCVPSGWDIYEWCRQHPDTTIAAGLRRVEKIMDFTDGGALMAGFSSGKDSTVSANLALLELSLRNLRVEACVDRHGEPRVDPLDAKWYGQRLYAMQTDAEVVYTSSNEYTKRFLERYGPNDRFEICGKSYGGDDMVPLMGGGTMKAREVYLRTLLGEHLEVPD